MAGWFDTDPRERVDAWLGEPVGSYRLLALALWQLVVVLYVVGDTALTAVVLELGGFEANAVARFFIDALGYVGLVVQKGLALACLAVLWRFYPTVGVDSPDPWRLIVPAIPVFRGVQLVAIHVENIAVLL